MQCVFKFSGNNLKFLSLSFTFPACRFSSSASLWAKKIAEKKLGARKHSFAVPFTIKFFSVFPRLSDNHFKIYSTQLFPFIGRNENQTRSLVSKDFTIPVKNLKNLAQKKGAGQVPLAPPLAQALK